MFRRSIFGALLVAAGTGAVLAYKAFKNRKAEDTGEEEEVHFIHISDEEEEPSEEEESEYPSEVKEVKAVYPYLDAEFVSALLAKNAEFNEEYPEDTLVTVKHSAEFPDETTAAGFAEIMEPAGYAVETAGCTVTASRKFFTQEGAVISDVLNVANQVAAIKGTYQDYTVTK